MQTNNPFFDDLAKLAGGALGAVTGMKGEVELLVRQQFERILADMDLVPREEFDAVKEMAAKARAGQEQAEARLAALEARMAEMSQAGGATKADKKTTTTSASAGKSSAAKA